MGWFSSTVQWFFGAFTNKWRAALFATILAFTLWARQFFDGLWSGLIDLWDAPAMTFAAFIPYFNVWNYWAPVKEILTALILYFGSFRLGLVALQIIKWAVRG